MKSVASAAPQRAPLPAATAAAATSTRRAADVAVVGGSLQAYAAAYLLAKRGKRTVLVEHAAPQLAGAVPPARPDVALHLPAASPHAVGWVALHTDPGLLSDLTILVAGRGGRRASCAGGQQLPKAESGIWYGLELRPDGLELREDGPQRLKWHRLSHPGGPRLAQSPPHHFPVQRRQRGLCAVAWRGGERRGRTRPAAPVRQHRHSARAR